MQRLRCRPKGRPLSRPLRPASQTLKAHGPMDAPEEERSDSRIRDGRDVPRVQGSRVAVTAGSHGRIDPPRDPSVDPGAEGPEGRGPVMAEGLMFHTIRVVERDMDVAG